MELPTQSVQVKETDNDQQPEPVVNNYNLARDRVRRNIVPPRRYGQVDLIYFALTVAEEIQAIEPINFREALNHKKSEEWITTMEEEMLSLEKNKTWILVDLPRNQRVVGANGYSKGNKVLKVTKRLDSKQDLLQEVSLLALFLCLTVFQVIKSWNIEKE